MYKCSTHKNSFNFIIPEFGPIILANMRRNTIHNNNRRLADYSMYKKAVLSVKYIYVIISISRLILKLNPITYQYIIKHNFIYIHYIFSLNAYVSRNMSLDQRRD